MKLMRGVRITRMVALAMIAAPEPVTTVIGLGMLGALTVPSAVMHHREAQKRKYLRHMLKDYLHAYRPFGYGMSYMPKTAPDLPYKEKEPLYRADGKVPASGRQYAGATLFQNTGEKVTYHTFDPRLASRRFDSGGTRRGFEGYWGRQTKLDIGAIRNSLNMAACLS